MRSVYYSEPGRIRTDSADRQTGGEHTTCTGRLVDSQRGRYCRIANLGGWHFEGVFLRSTAADLTARRPGSRPCARGGGRVFLIRDKSSARCARPAKWRPLISLGKEERVEQGLPNPGGRLVKTNMPISRQGLLLVLGPSGKCADKESSCSAGNLAPSLSGRMTVFSATARSGPALYRRREVGEAGCGGQRQARPPVPVSFGF